MRGDEVASLQARLAQLGYTDMLGKPLRADGLFGPITRLALQSFQHDSGLAADGIADGATVAASRRVVRERANQAAGRIAVTSDRTYDVD
ncbi:peptidoglycan-binding domain-containing protein [Luteibacter sp. NPDC031894]|uniref:peptidoglycan-binding domain-containing protein n=1 Tax=Luteibacter sp. NPDC031894 TaxID=3390572 RepID=UPI003CFC16B3